jgi:hypothetical protein
MRRQLMSESPDWVEAVKRFDASVSIVSLRAGLTIFVFFCVAIGIEIYTPSGTSHSFNVDSVDSSPFWTPGRATNGQALTLAGWSRFGAAITPRPGGYV